MDAWVGWLIAAVILAVGEVVTTGFYLAPFAGGAALAAVAAGAGAGVAVSAAVFVVASLGLLLFVRPIARRHLHVPPQLRTGTAALVGQTAVVVQRISNHEHVGQARIDGEIWSARAFDDDRVFEPGDRVEVVQIKGATALVD
jgi:membrane protein implicated in regulation of membrane protease activity